MSELQIGLLTIGIVVVVGVYGYGFLQQRQYRRKFGTTFKEQREDALYQTPQSGAAADVLVDNLEYKESHQMMPDDGVCSLLGEETDFVVSITPKSPLSSNVLASMWAQRFDFGKNVNACGVNAETGHWERLIPESHPVYSEFKIGLQLADRSGHVSEVRLTSFHDVLRDIAAQVQAEIVLPSIQDTFKQAKLLDSFCAEVDQMIGLNILPGGTRLLFASEIANAAELNGMQLQADGRFHLLDAQGLTLFTLSSMDETLFQHHTLTQTRVPGLTLLLDVPRVECPAQRFDEIAELAREIASALRCTLVDDHRVALGDSAVAHIREQVVAIEVRMSEGKVPPGTIQARRLFA